MPTVTSIHKGEMLFETTIGSHTVLSDVPPSPDWGGQNRVPTPPDYFIVSLGSCVAAFVVRYGQQAGLNTEGLQVILNFEKAVNPAHVKDIKIDIHLPNAEIGVRSEAIKRVCKHCTVSESIARMSESGLDIRVFGRQNT